MLVSCRAASNFFNRSAISESVLDDEDEDAVESVLELLPVEELSLVWALAAPPGPPENVLANTFFNSLAWSEVSLPAETSLSIRLSILDCMSCGDGGVLELALELDDELLAPLFNAESMSSSAEDKAL
ncbi:hypothetical protein BRAS3843_1150013 [Bradyrhizobium sp. STM 3843]|nr:hypothetical protein BRAS3843_1150013 [Bradyrhizobium sp. STM 3843]